MNKQIEEMAKTIHAAKMNDIIAKVTADIDDLIDCAPMNVIVAEALYNAGYRKSTDVAREVINEINNSIGPKDFNSNEITTGYLWAIADVRRLLLKLKKKYESEGVK